MCAPRRPGGAVGGSGALRTAAAGAGKEVLVLAPTDKAVDQALHDDAGDRGYTIVKALHLMQSGELRLDRHCVIVVDEASMVATPDLHTLLTETTKATVKTVLVGDPYQLAPVKARSGMFEQLCDELPRTQRLSEVWWMRDPEERQASLALRSGHGNRLRQAIGWYRTHDRLRTGDEVAMASDALAGYLADRNTGKDALVVCDTWEMADALNRRLHDTLTTEGPVARAARGQELRVGDLIVSRRNDAPWRMSPCPGAATPTRPTSTPARPQNANLTTLRQWQASSFSCGVTPNTRPRIVFAASPPTTTGPGPCTSKPNRPPGPSCPKQSANSSTATTNASSSEQPRGANTPLRSGSSGPLTSDGRSRPRSRPPR
jgi:hypothetical protein